MKKVCMYCGYDLTHTNYEFFIVKQEIEQRLGTTRHLVVGFCCDDCEREGMPTLIGRKNDP